MTQEIIHSIKNLAAVKPFLNLKALNRDNNPVLAAVIEFVEFGHHDHIRHVGPHKSGFNGWEIRYGFPNGYGASVVRYQLGFAGIGSYGAEDGLWQLAVLAPDGSICYSTPITYDVLGWLTPGEVNTTLAQIKDLPPYQEGDNSSLDEGLFLF